jgi:hypothetical protein
MVRDGTAHRDDLDLQEHLPDPIWSRHMQNVKQSGGDTLYGGEEDSTGADIIESQWLSGCYSAGA